MNANRIGLVAALIVIVATSLALSACEASGYRVDGSSRQALMASTQKVAASLSGDKKIRFQAAVEKIHAWAEKEGAFERWECMRENPSTCSRVAWYVNELLEEKLAGKTADEIIDIAEAL